MLSRDRVEARFGAMDRAVRVVVLGGSPRLDERARHLIEVLERKWSRYRAGSELSRVNESGPRAVVVSPDTYGLVSRAVGAWRATGGRFDPTVRVGPAPAPAGPSPGCAHVELDPRHTTVRLLAGVHLDTGGIARGFAADLAVVDLVRSGASGALVSIGTDVRVAGDPPRPDGWYVDLDDPRRPGTLGRLRIAQGAISTYSSRAPSRSARDAAIGVAPLVDPATGAVARTGIVAATVVAGEAWWAQAIAKAACVAGPDAGIRVMAELGVTGFVVLDDGGIREAPGLGAFC
ncbi:MAG: hypothetical protein AMXMBFR46_20790 [Acidimicrobiia bacterium]